jgi:hypothetical protein
VAQDPQYVKLIARMTSTCLVDLTSQWSIAGLDVKKFPSDDDYLAADFVREKLAYRVLEEATEAEYQAANGFDTDYLAQNNVKVVRAEVQGVPQEAQIVGSAMADHRKLAASRGLLTGGRSLEEDSIRRAALLTQQGEEVPSPEDAGLEEQEFSKEDFENAVEVAVQRQLQAMAVAGGLQVPGGPLSRAQEGGDSDKGGLTPEEVAQAASDEQAASQAAQETSATASDATPSANKAQRRR